MSLLAIIIGLSIAIVAVEYLLWSIFRKRIEGLVLPRSSDSSALHFFSIGRVGFCALFHTIVLLVFCNAVLFFLW